MHLHGPLRDPFISKPLLQRNIFEVYSLSKIDKAYQGCSVTHLDQSRIPILKILGAGTKRAQIVSKTKNLSHNSGEGTKVPLYG